MDKRKLTKQRMEDLQAITYLAYHCGYHQLSTMALETSKTIKQERRAMRLAHKFLERSFMELKKVNR